MSEQTKWFSLRGEQYQYDGKWWRKWEPSHNERIPESYCIQGADGKWCHVHNENGGVVDGECVGCNDYRVPCSQPFQVGDRVKVVRADCRYCWQKCEISSIADNHCLVFGEWIPCGWVEPAEPSTDYIPPDGWRVKGDDEVVTSGDYYSHMRNGDPYDHVQDYAYTSIGTRVEMARQIHMPNGGYILTPILSPIVSPLATPQTDVSQEQQTDDGWEIYEPVVGEPYSPGTQRKHIYSENYWCDEGDGQHGDNGDVDYRFIYRRPIQKQPKPLQRTVDSICPICGIEGSDHSYNCHERVSEILSRDTCGTAPQPARKPLDIDLLSIERKINLAAKDNPALLKWWRAEKERLAIEAGKRMGGGM